MSLNDLNEKIINKQAKLAVIGLGYVGLPVACQFAKTGFNVLGIELKADTVNKLNRGVSPIDGIEPGLDELLSEVISSNNLQASSDYQELQNRDIIIIAVETPVDEHHIPHYEALRSALISLGPNLRKGSMVIVESTIAPGTMDTLVAPTLESSSSFKINRDFYLGHCPERVMPGKLLANLRNVNRVVGGMTPETAETMVTLYRHMVLADLDPTDCITAELVKTTENAYRDVQIAFANEVALICEAVGGDVWKVRQLVNKSPFRNMHLPGAGVGGHCIPKDPWLLAYGVEGKNVPLRIIPAARAVNDSMPLHVVDLLENGLQSCGKELKGSKILVLGYAYLEDSDDTRNSPSEVLVKRLQGLGAEVVIHDPYVEEYQGDVYDRAAKCDAIVLMIAHSVYRNLNLERLKVLLKTHILVDGRNLVDPKKAQKAGFHYRGIGQAN